MSKNMHEQHRAASIWNGSMHGVKLKSAVKQYMPPDESCAAQELQELLAELLGEAVPPDMPLMEAGLDSIGAVELRNAVGARFGVELPATATFDYPTAHALAAHVAARAGPNPGDRAQGSAGEGLQEQSGWGVPTDGGMEEIAAQVQEIASELLGAAVPDDQVQKRCCPLSLS